jgi:hypothetical protein
MPLGNAESLRLIAEIDSTLNALNRARGYAVTKNGIRLIGAIQEARTLLDIAVDDAVASTVDNDDA